MSRVTAEARRMTIEEFVKGLWPVPFFLLTLWLAIAVPVLGALASLVLIAEAMRRREQERQLPWRLPLVVSVLTLILSIVALSATGFWNLG